MKHFSSGKKREPVPSLSERKGNALPSWPEGDLTDASEDWYYQSALSLSETLMALAALVVLVAVWLFWYWLIFSKH